MRQKFDLVDHDISVRFVEAGADMGIFSEIEKSTKD